MGRYGAWADVGHEWLQHKFRRTPAAAGSLVVPSAPDFGRHPLWLLHMPQAMAENLSSARQSRWQAAVRYPEASINSVSPTGNSQNYKGRI